MGMVFEGKKGIIVKVFSYIAYFIGALVLILLLNIAGCLIDNKKAEAAIEVDVNLAASVRADAQLGSYLRTMVPPKAGLDERLEWLEKNKDTKYVKELLNSIKIDFGDVKGFLDKHPEVYEGKDYSEFISGLHAIYSTGSDDEKKVVKQAFRAVTAIMFLSAVKDFPKKGESLFYLLPLGVDFSPSDFKPSSEEDVCSTYELCAQYLPPEVIPRTDNPLIYIPPQMFASQSVQAIPLADASVAKVEFRYYPEHKSMLPEP